MHIHIENRVYVSCRSSKNKKASPQFSQRPRLNNINWSCSVKLAKSSAIVQVGVKVSWFHSMLLSWLNFFKDLPNFHCMVLIDIDLISLSLKIVFTKIFIISWRASFRHCRCPRSDSFPKQYFENMIWLVLQSPKRGLIGPKKRQNN